jgi:hypothetical protein
MSELQFAALAVRIWRLRQRIAKGGKKKQIAAARRKLWALATQLAYAEPRR